MFKRKRWQDNADYERLRVSAWTMVSGCRTLFLNVCFLRCSLQN